MHVNFRVAKSNNSDSHNNLPSDALGLSCQDVHPLLLVGAEAMDMLHSGSSLLQTSLCQLPAQPAKIQANIQEKVEVFTELELLYKKYPEAKTEL